GHVGSPVLGAGQKGLGAVDRVHDPAPARTARRAGLLAEQAVRRPARLQLSGQQPVDGQVGLPDRGAIGLELARGRAPEVPEGQLGGGGRQLEGQTEVGVPVRRGGGRHYSGGREGGRLPPVEDRIGRKGITTADPTYGAAGGRDQ